MRRPSPRFKWLLGVALLALSVTTHATQVRYQLDHLGGSTWQYRFTLTNDGTLGASVPLRWFSIDFATSLFDDATLVIASAPPIPPPGTK